MADRDIPFRIGVASHPETNRRLAELADSVKKTMGGIESHIASVGAKAVETSRIVSAAGASPRGVAGGGAGVAVAERPIVSEADLGRTETASEA